MADAAASGAPVVGFTLHEGDCLGPEGMARLEDGSVDVAIFDPPYSEHVHASCMSGLTAANRREAAANVGVFAARKALDFDHITPEQIEANAKHCSRLVKRWVLAFSDVESCHLWREAFERAGLEYVRTIGWQKYGGAPQFTGDRPAVAFETLTLCHRPGRKRWNGKGKAGWYDATEADAIYSHSIVLGQRGEARCHSAQKPIDLMCALVRDFSEPGELVMDQYAGSATTGEACIRLGRRFVGFERGWGKSEADRSANVAIARRRLEAAREQPGLPFAKAPRPKQGRLLP